MIRNVALRLVFAVAVAALSAGVQSSSDEVAVYGYEGTVDDNVHPRLTGGWPAAFIADSSATSVPFQLGVEDDFRPGAFFADVAFWYVISGLFSLLGRRTQPTPPRT